MPLPDGPTNAATTDAEAVLSAARLIEPYAFFGFIWLDEQLAVIRTYGRIAAHVEVGAPLSSSIIAIIGLEADIRAVRATPGRILELPAVAIATEDGQGQKLNFSFFWDQMETRFLALIYRSSAQSELELELSRQIRARLIAEAETAKKSIELAQANADLEQFAAIISHDLKSPLRHIRQTAEAQLQRHADADDTTSLQSIASYSRHLSRMLTDLLDYSALGRKYEAIERLETRALVEDIAAPWRDLGHVISLHGSWPEIDTLKAPLALIIRNLIANAVQHHDRASAQISISCASEGQWLSLSFGDDGPGIACEHQDTVFAPFRTIEQAPHSQSTGMGLALVKRAAESVGGSIKLFSAPHSDRGATFTILWPRSIALT